MKPFYSLFFTNGEKAFRETTREIWEFKRTGHFKKPVPVKP